MLLFPIFPYYMLYYYPQCTIVPLIPPLFLHSAFVQLSDRIKNYRSNKLELTWPDEGHSGVMGRGAVVVRRERITQVMWHPSPVCNQLQNVTKNKTVHSPLPLFSPELPLCEYEQRLWGVTEVFLPFPFYRLRLKGRHPCLLSIRDPHLLPKCSVAHKVLAMDKERKNCYGVTGWKLAQSRLSYDY